MQDFAAAVRKACLPAIWSQGVKIAREGGVSVVSASDREITVRVRAPGFAIAPTVTLHLEDDEWSCDCNGKVDPCAHVAGATIAALQAKEKGESLAPAPKEETARLVYRLARQGRLLALTRVVIRPDGKEEKMGGALGSSLAQGKVPAGLTPTHEDLLVDRILGAPAREVIPLARLADIFRALSNGAEVFFEGKPIRVSGEGIGPQATLSDGPNGGFVLRLERDPAIAEVLSQGVARVGDTIHPLADTQMTGEMLERLPLTRPFRREDESELVTRVLPDLEKRLRVTVTAKALRRVAKDARPRIAMDLSHQGHTLSILPTLVYGDPPIARVDGDAVVALGGALPMRRRDEERAVLAKLRDVLSLVPGRRVDFDGAEAVRFATKLRAWQESNGDAARAVVFEKAELAPRIVFDGTVFDVVFELEGGPAPVPAREGTESSPPPAATVRHADAAAVLRAWRDGLELVPLDGGGWAPLPSGWLEKFGHHVADLLAARGPDKKLPRASLPDVGALFEALEMPKPRTTDKLAPLLEGFEKIPSASLPEGFNATLRSYQHAGVDWLTFLRDAELGGVLADDMGLGKTVQTIAALRGRVLVVCPKSVVYNWQSEIARFRPNLRTAIYHGSGRALDVGADVTLTTYAVLRLDAAKLSEPEWDVVVLDEAQAIKNESSQTARAAFQLRGKLRLALSGTPVENRLEELWSVMNFANPGLLGGRSTFQERYATPIANGERDAAARLRARIRPFVLRRLKRDVLTELPPRTDDVLHVELDDRERSVYDAVRAATKKDVVEKLAQGGGASVLAALEALLRLRQASCHPSLVPGQTAESSSKIERLLLALEDAASEGHKSLVFSQWTSLLDLVEPHLREAGIAFTRLDGSTRDRGAVVDAFQDEKGPPVMLVSLKAGGTGLNLTAADHVFLLDPWWNPAVENQAADRAHRIGQERPVIVYRLVAKDTVEERILALQEKKRALADVALGEADQARAISREELLALLD